MRNTISAFPCSFTAVERELIRREFSERFGQHPSLAAGIHLRRWRSGPRAGQPGLPLVVQGLVERGLMEVLSDGPYPRASFTEEGLAALRHLASNPRWLDPERFGHLRRELGFGQEPLKAVMAELA